MFFPYMSNHISLWDYFTSFVSAEKSGSADIFISISLPLPKYCQIFFFKIRYIIAYVNAKS